MIRQKLRSLRRDKNGSPALEFALVAPLFFGAVFSTFELGRALFERNRLAGAAAVAMRTVALDNDASDTQIANAIKGTFTEFDTTKLNIVVCNKTVASQVFKEVKIVYNHDLLVDIGNHFGTVTLQATRYAPAVEGSASGSACASPDPDPA